jgi:hypothetical protein
MNKAELIRQVGKLRDIPENSLAYLDRMGIMDDALGEDFDEQAVSRLVEAFDELRAASPESTSRFRRDEHGDDDSDSNVLRGSLGPLQREREAAVEEYRAMCTTCDPETRKFRKEVLEERLLTEEEARALVQSPAARFFDETCFEYAGGEIPLVGHRAALDWYTRESGEEWEVWYRAGVTVEPPGMTRVVAESEYEPPWVDTGRSKWRDRKYGGGGSELFFVDYKGRPRRRAVWKGSPLEGLRRLSESLARTYRWEPAQATMFVLTGAIPAVPALKVGTSVKFFEELHDAKTPTPEYIDAKRIIEASPWVSSETVRKQYRKAQIKVMGTSGGKAPGLKHLRLFRFVTKRVEPMCTRGSARMPNGKSLVREWNEANPQWKAYKDTRRFWRDYNRIKRTIVVGPPYQTHRAASDRQPRQTDGS